MASLFLLLFYVTVLWSTASASFTSTVAKATLTMSNTLLGTYSRSNTVATLSLLEQEKLEEAQEALVQSALTLALLDVGGGAVQHWPLVKKLVNYVKSKPEFRATREALKNFNKALKDEAAKAAGQIVDRSSIRGAKQALERAFKLDVKKFPRLSKAGKAFTKAIKWFRGTSLVDVLGPLTDTLTIGLNIWGLEMAIRDNNPYGIAAASVSIAAGVVGLGTFIAAIATGSALLGPIGALGGAILGVVATLIELFGSPGYDKQAVEEYMARLKQLRELKDACIAQIDRRMEFLDKVGSPYTDVYANNQAASIVAGQRGALYLFDCFYWTEGMSDEEAFCPQFKNSLHLRRFIGSNIDDLTEAEEELSNGTYVCMGKFRGIVSPFMPLASSETGWGKDIGFIGFDFYGKFKQGTSYQGAHVFVNSEYVSDEELNAIYINTSIPADTEQNDVISISDYKKFKKWDTITIHTGSGNDCLNINGMIGEFHSDYSNLLTADMGPNGCNILSFQGMSKDREDIKGVFFDTKTGVVKYFHGENRAKHKLGTVRSVGLLHGSPFDDHIILHNRSICREISEDGEENPNDVFTVIQTSGRNVYEFDFDDLNALVHERARKFRIVDKSNHSLKIDLLTNDASNIESKNILLKYKTLIVHNKAGVPVIEVELDNATISGNLFINNANPRPIHYAHISPWGLNSDIINYSIPFPSPMHPFPRFSDRNETLLLKFQTNTATNAADFSIDMKRGNNAVIISDKYLLEPLGVDGESVNITLNQWPSQVRSGTYQISIENFGDPIGYVIFPIEIELKNVERIINEYGDEVVCLKRCHNYRPAVPMNLYDQYIEKMRQRFDIRTTENEIEDE